MKRLPLWTVDEWILGLDTYFMLGPKEIRSGNPLIIELSNLLRSLPIHKDAKDDEIFRNALGIATQLRGFMRCDLGYDKIPPNAKSKLQEKVWNLYSQDRDRLHKVAEAIKNSLPLPFEFSCIPDMDEEDFPYGRILYQYHKYIESTSPVVREFKKRQRRRGFLECEVCGFDFYRIYGNLGKDFIEVHHTLDIAEYRRGMEVKDEDLIAVCSNCHRIWHRITKPVNRYELSERGLRCIITSGI